MRIYKPTPSTLKTVVCCWVSALLFVIFLPSPSYAQKQADHQKTSKQTAEDNLESIKSIIESAKKGDPESQFQLGLIFSTINHDYVEAAKWLTMAATHGHSEAQWQLGVFYHEGMGVTQNKLAAHKLISLSAKQGNPEAQYLLGENYSRGDGVAKNKPEAIKWWNKAAIQGNTESQKELGLAYYTGDGVSKNDEAAAKWFRKAALSGNQFSMYSLGYLYSVGHGVQKNYDEANRWLGSAIEKNTDVGTTKAAKEQIALIEMDKKMLATVTATREKTESENDMGLMRFGATMLQSNGSFSEALGNSVQSYTNPNYTPLPPPPAPKVTNCTTWRNTLSCTTQ